MNIGFINPPSEFLIDQRVFLPLGILRVATHLQHFQPVHFLDLSGVKDYSQELLRFILTNGIDVVGFTATTPQILVVHNLCHLIKQTFPAVKIILGGPHITLLNSSMEKGTPDIIDICQSQFDRILDVVDTVIIGDGEYAIIEAITTQERIINSEKEERFYLKTPYDDVAIANRDFLDLSTYHYSIDGNRSTNIISQMGCPYKCEFCSGRMSKSFNRIRSRSIDNILLEIDQLVKKYNYTGFMFYDDEINLKPDYFVDLLVKLIDYQKKEHVQLKFRGFTRSTLLNDEQAELMYQAGFRWLLIGFESGSDLILSNTSKGCTVSDNTRSFGIARRNGLKVKALMSIGHPGESSATIQDSIHWLKEVRPDETDITIVSVYPGSTYFYKSILLNENTLKYTTPAAGSALYIKNIDFLSESNFYKSKSDNYVSYVSTDFLTREEIVQERLKLEQITKEWGSDQL